MFAILMESEVVFYYLGMEYMVGGKVAFWSNVLGIIMTV